MTAAEVLKAIAQLAFHIAQPLRYFQTGVSLFTKRVVLADTKYLKRICRLPSEAGAPALPLRTRRDATTLSAPPLQNLLDTSPPSLAEQLVIRILVLLDPSATSRPRFLQRRKRRPVHPLVPQRTERRPACHAMPCHA